MTAGTPPAAAAGGGDPLLRGSRASRLLGRHPVLVSTASTIAFVAVLGAVISVAPGTPEVARNFFSPTAMRESFFGTETTPAIWKAFIFNIEMFVVAEVLILVFALLIAVVRQMRSPLFFPLRVLAIAYTDLFRGIPLLLVIYFTGFGLPALGLKGIPTSLAVLGVTALVLSYSAYVSEVYRAGIESVHASQVAAARSLGLSHWQSLRFVVLPQAVRGVIPPLLNDFISLQKDTALVAVLGPIEAARAAQIYGASAFNYSSLVVAAILFLLLTIPLARFTDRLIERDRRRREAGAIA